MSTNTMGGYTPQLKLDKNSWITDPRIPDPENLPQPLGWTLIVRPYPVKMNESKTSLILPSNNETIDYMNYLTNIGRVVSIGPCCWSRADHRDKEGNQFDWVKVGDFITYPKNSGSRRKFKDVSFVMLVDDEINEKLTDPQIFDNSLFKIDIPDEDYEKYNIKKV